jgi:coenzyme F420 hydrogenase subunit beta
LNIREGLAQKAVAPKIFGTLLTTVIRTGKCVGCGACVAVCPVNILRMQGDTPTMSGKCILCEFCYYQCPVTDSSTGDLELGIFGRKRDVEDTLGISMGMYFARTKRKEIMDVCQNGGVVTSILGYALSKGLIDSAVVTDKSGKEPWKPVPKVALTYDNLLEAAGTKYSTGPTMLALSSAVLEYQHRRIAFVGTPCQILAVRKAQLHPHGVLKLGSAVYFTVGLFCLENFLYDKLFNEYLEQQKNIDLRRISKLQIDKGRFKVAVDGKDEIDVPLSEVKPYTRNNCQLCGDSTAELADISIGSEGSQNGWSTVIVRTKKGMDLF